ncbi:MAG: phosphatidylglycerol lysyltransferase domain-containing protein [Patescibacteria group bacterium]
MENINAIGDIKNLTLPLFPSFDNLKIGHMHTVDERLKNCQKYSDYNFFSMITYDVNNNMQLSILNDNLIVKFYDYITLKPFYSFLGVNKVEETIETLLKKSSEEGLEPTLKLIPEISIAKSMEKPGKCYTLAEDEDNFDYICSIKKLSELKGSNYNSQRNMINRLLKDSPNINYKTTKNLADLKTIILELFDRWEINKANPKEDNEIEHTAIKRAIEYSKYFNLLNIVVYDGQKPVGFLISDIFDNYPTLAFCKGDVAYRGIFTYIFHVTAIELEKLGFEETNFEQDLGIPGLRQAKKSWHPIRYLKKYTIKPAGI